MKKLFSRSLLMTFVIALISTIAQGQVTYTASPSGWTSVPGKNITATPINQTVTLHGNLLVARAVISGKNVTFQAKKSDGTIFQNATILYLHENDANGTRKKISRNSAGSSVLNLDFEFDFTSGSKKYCLTLCSNTSSGDQIWYYTSPITITAKSAEVPQPDPNTFYGHNITSNSFEACWDHVTGATMYEINVNTERSSSGIVFNNTTSNNYITVTGLKPATSYYFQVRAKVNGQWGDFSKYCTNPTTTRAAQVKLTIVGGTYFDNNAKTLTKGKSASFSIKVKNEGNDDWSGSFFLKETGGSTDWIPWYNQTIHAGSSTTLTGNYTPDFTGSKEVTLYYQTGGSGDGAAVGSGSYKNPFTITVEGDELPKPDPNTFYGHNITSNSFEACWDHVTGATMYEINVNTERSSSGIVFNKTTSNNYITVTDLKPATSYYFQVRAKVNGQWGDFSKYCTNPTTTLATPAKVKLTIVGGTYFGSSTLTKGKSASFNIKIKNEGNENWSGAFYLKAGGYNWIPWGGKNLPAGVTLELNSNFTPTVDGNYTLTLYYQTGGEGDGLPVDKGYFKNPFTVTVTDGQSTTEVKLAKPNNESFQVSNITETGFTATWAAVSGAEKYDIMVLSANGSVNNPDYYNSVTSPKCNVTGLKPGTSYKFRVRARNASSKGEYSSLSTVDITTKTVSEQSKPADLSLVLRHNIGTSTPSVGQEYQYKACVSNSSLTTWSGKLILKEGGTTLYSWNLDINGKSSKPVDYTYVPKEAGSKKLTIYYQTSGSSQEIAVPQGALSNPLTITVKEAVTLSANLKLTTDVNSSVANITLGGGTTLSYTVKNYDKTEWNGTLYITDNGTTLAKETLTLKGNGGSKTMSFEWTPPVVGTHQIAAYYKPKGYVGTWQLISADGHTNPLFIQVTKEAEVMEAKEAYVSQVTKSIAPTTVNEGTHVFYHFLVKNKAGKPLSGYKLVFEGSKLGQISTVATNSDGLTTLHLETMGVNAVADRGGKAVLKLSKLLDSGDKPVTVLTNNADDTKIELTINNGIFIDEIQEVKIGLSRGLKGAAGMSFDPNLLSPEDKEVAEKLGSKAGGTLSLDMPVSLGFKYDLNGNLKSFNIDCDKTASIEGEGKLCNFVDFSLGGDFAVKESTVFNTNDLKSSAVMGIICAAEALYSGTDRLALAAIHVLESWFDKDHNLTKSIESGPSYSTSYGFSAGAKVNIFNAFPEDYVKKIKDNKWIKSLVTPVWDAVGISKWNVAGKAVMRFEPDKEKVLSPTLKLEGEGRSLKLQLSSLSTSDIIDFMFRNDQDWWMNANLSNFYKETTSYWFVDLLGDILLKKSGTFSINEEEWFNNNGGQNQLEELSAKISLVTDNSFDITKIPKLKSILPAGTAANAGASATFSTKFSSQGQWAHDLQYIANYDPQKLSFVTQVYPSLSGENYIGSPNAYYDLLKRGSVSSLSYLTINDPETYPLNKSLKMEQQIGSKVALNISIPILTGFLWSLAINGSASIEAVNYPSESYYSFVHKRFFPVTVQPTLSIEETAGRVVERITDYIDLLFNDDDKNKIDEESERQMNTAKADGSSSSNFTNIGKSHTSTDKRMAPRYVRRRRAALVENPQTDICTMAFHVNENTKNFSDDTRLTFAHFYPAGDLFGITDKGDTLFVVSEVFNLLAQKDETFLEKVPNGTVKLDSYVGADDLSPFGFFDTQALDIYYAKKGSDIWRYVGPAGQPLEIDSLGSYMMATSIKNDVMAPKINVSMDYENRTLHVMLSDNIGIKVRSLQFYVNNSLRELETLNETSFELQLTDDDMQYMIDVYATVYDIAGNKGELYQMFNLDMPQRPSETQQPGYDIEVTDISTLDNVVYLAPVEVHAGEEATLSVKMKNNVNAEGFGFDLYLPYGMNFKLDADGFPEAYLSTERTSARKTNTFESVIRPDGALRVMAASTNGSVISGSDGEVALVTILVDKDVQPGTYPLLLREIAISDSDARSYDTDAVRTTITVLDGASNIHEVMSPRHFDNHIYNLQGQRVTTLTKGIYIKNGRKFVVR